MRTLLLDADILAFVVAARVQTSIDWDGDGQTTVDADPEEAKRETRQWIQELTDKLEADEAIVCLSDATRRYWRHDIYPKYKFNRTHGSKPIALDAVREYLRTDAFKSKQVPTLEADDVLGILATHPTLVKGERIIVTADKDLKQIPGLHFNIRKPDEGVSEVTVTEGDKFFLQQCLTGDTTDGFPGCPKIGPVNAKKILTKAAFKWAEGPNNSDWMAAMWKAIAATYAKKGISEADALTQARIARICRHTDYNFKRKEVILWSPPVS